MDLLASIPSPDWRGFSIGPLTIHAYGIVIGLGIIVALWLTRRRWIVRGGTEDDLWSIAIWAIPAGIIGGRLYHVIVNPGDYFGPGSNPLSVLYIWQGGLGIMGAITLGITVAWWAARRNNINIAAFADAAAPGVLAAQAIGRLGNWFNQELFGRPTTLPWGLEIDYVRDGRINPTWPGPEYLEGTLFHPTFLYEMLWNLLGVVLLIWLGRKLRLAHGQIFLGYAAYYLLGRVLNEFVRIDPTEVILGLRLHQIIAMIGFVIVVTVLAINLRRHHGTPDHLYLGERQGEAAARLAGELSDGGGEAKTPVVSAASALTVEDPDAAGPRGEEGENFWPSSGSAATESAAAGSAEGATATGDHASEAIAGEGTAQEPPLTRREAREREARKGAGPSATPPVPVVPRTPETQPDAETPSAETAPPVEVDPSSSAAATPATPGSRPWELDPNGTESTAELRRWPSRPADHSEPEQKSGNPATGHRFGDFGAVTSQLRITPQHPRHPEEGEHAPEGDPDREDPDRPR